MLPCRWLGASRPPPAPSSLARGWDVIRRVAVHQPHLLAATGLPLLPLPSSGQNQRDFSALRKSDKGFSPAPHCLCEEAGCSGRGTTGTFNTPADELCIAVSGCGAQPAGAGALGTVSACPQPWQGCPLPKRCLLLTCALNLR